MSFRLKIVGFKDHKWLTPLLTGLSLFYVLYFFKGYNIETGLSLSGHSLFIRALCFGLLTSLVFYIYEYPVSRNLAINTAKRKIIGYLVTTTIGACATFLLFNYFWGWTEWNVKAFRLILVEYHLVMVIPLSILWLFQRSKPHKPPIESEKLLFSSENGKDQLQLQPQNFLGAQSAGNYVELFYHSKGQLKKQLIRNSLKNIEEQYANSPFIQRCHRSYLINPANIQNAVLKNGKVEVDLGYFSWPVSAKYQEDFHS